MMKKVLAGVLVTAMALNLAACGGASSTSETTKAAEKTAETTVAEATTEAGAPAGTEADKPAAGSGNTGEYSFNVDNVAEHTFAMSTTATSGSSLADVTHYFADQVKELSGGKIQVDVYEGSTLGSEMQNLEALTAGTLDLAIIGVEFYVNSIPQIGAVMLPYMYDDYDQVQRVLEGEAGQYASQQLKDVAKVKNLGYYVMAFRNIYSTKPITTVDDLKGFKIRVPESSLYVDTFKMMGAAPTPLAMGEVYTAIDTGVVSGVENTPDTCLHNSFFEVAKYFNQTNHLNSPTTFSMSDKVFESLNEDEKNLFCQAGLNASRYGLETTKTSDAAYREELKEKGMEFIESDVDGMRAKIDYNAYDFMQSEEAKHLLELVEKTK